MFIQQHWVLLDMFIRQSAQFSISIIHFIVFKPQSLRYHLIYRLNIQKTMENHHFIAFFIQQTVTGWWYAYPSEKSQLG